MQAAQVNGTVEGDILGGGSEVTVNNVVSGNVELTVEKLVIASAAKIKGDLTYTGEAEAAIHSSAQIAGKTTHKLPEAKKQAAPKFLGELWGKFLAFLMIFLIGLIIILLLPVRITAMADAIRTYPWQSLGWGAVILFATPLAAIFRDYILDTDLNLCYHYYCDDSFEFGFSSFA